MGSHYHTMPLGKRKVRSDPDVAPQSEKKFKSTLSQEKEGELENGEESIVTDQDTSKGPQPTTNKDNNTTKTETTTVEAENEEEVVESENEEEDVAKLYLVTAQPLEQTGYSQWKLDDNKDKIHPFFETNSIAPADRRKWPTFKEFKQAVRLAERLEKMLTGVQKISSAKTNWHGFVVTRAFEDQEAQQAFEEALGLSAQLLDAEAGLYYEDLEEDSVMFVQEEEELEDYTAAEVKKMNSAKKLVLEQLDDWFTVGFCSEVSTCLFPEFWGGSTEEGVLVGVLATIHPLPMDPDEE